MPRDPAAERPVRVSDHAVDRYIERHATTSNGPVISVYGARNLLEGAIEDARYISHEETLKSTWLIFGDIYITVVNGTVETVHPAGSKPKEKERPSKRVRRK